MKEKNKKKKRDSVRKIKNRHLKGGNLVDLGNRNALIETLKVIQEYSRTGEINLSDDRLAFQVYNCILQSKSELIADNNGVFRALNNKAVFSKLMNTMGVISYLTTLSICAMNFGYVGLDSILMMTGFAVCGTGFVVGSHFLQKNVNTEIIEQLIIDMEDKYGVECLQNEQVETIDYQPSNELAVTTDVMQTSFLEEVKSVTSYIKRNPKLSFDRELQALTTLSHKFIDAKRDSIRENNELRKFDFIDALTLIELQVFSKCGDIDLKPFYMMSINGTQLTKRLLFMGLSEATILEDNVLKNVYDEISRISQTPYVGCEREMALLFKSAQEYCRRTYPLNDISIKRLPVVENPTSQLLREVSAIHDIASEKINIAIAVAARRNKNLLPGAVLEEAPAIAKAKTTI